MKKAVLIFCLVAGFAATIAAQPRAIGGRLSLDLEASYQHELTNSTYFQIDAGLASYGLGLQAVGTHNWIFATPDWSDYGKWEWFAGVGGGAGVYWDGNYQRGLFLGVAGNIGLSFTFPFDLQLSADYRPVIGPIFGDGTAGFHQRGLWATGFSVRYAF